MHAVQYYYRDYEPDWREREHWRERRAEDWRRREAWRREHEWRDRYYAPPPVVYGYGPPPPVVIRPY
ncbi:MAG TPA: hypothetical protein VE650_00290 [Acetobacteraceae bacterium]|nr:hypothetical protein [Acetobacteraceae bacterium]